MVVVVIVVVGATYFFFFLVFFELVFDAYASSYIYSEKTTSNEQVASAFTLNFHKSTFDVLFFFQNVNEYKRNDIRIPNIREANGKILISLICIFDTYIMVCGERAAMIIFNSMSMCINVN